jgi:hypothetical protein
MSTPENYGSQQPWQDPAAPPTAPVPPQPQYPPPAPPQYGQAPEQPQYGQPPYGQEPQYGQQPQHQPPAPPGQYPAPPAQYPPAPPTGQYPPTAPTAQYPPAPGQYPPPPGQYPPPPGEYPPAGQYPIATPPPAKKRGPLAIIGGILVTLLVVCGVIVAKVALRNGVDALVNDDDTSTSDTVAPKTPFEGTPVEAFAQGEAGITVPAATDVPGFSKDDVTKALADVKKAMIAGRLDTKMLTGHDTSVFMDLFAPAMRTDLQDYFDKKQFMPFATQIAPSFKLTTDPVRVKGEMKFRGTTVDGLRVIEVTTNYVWVYAFTGDLKEPGDHLVSIHDKITWLFPHPEDVIDEAIGMNLSEWEAFASNMDCDLFDQSLIGLGKPRYVAGGSQQDPDDAFDPNGSLDVTDTC